MLKNIITYFNNLEKITFQIMKYGLLFCFIICISSVLILFTYNFAVSSPFLFYLGINLFRASLILGTEFIICGFIVDGIKKQFI